MANTLSKTINPQLVEVSFVNNLNFLQKYSTYLDLVSEFRDQLQAYFDYDNALYASDFIEPLHAFYSNLNKKYASFDVEFIIYYVKKYNALADEIKKAIEPKIDKLNFLSPVSDSIGILTNTETLLTDSVIPLADVNVSIYPAPFVYPSNLKNKIRPISKAIAIDLSRKNTTLYRNNIVNIQFKTANASEAHGSNLVVDFDSYRRARQTAMEATKALSQSFGQLFKLVSYYSNLNDYSGYNSGDLTMNLQRIADVSYKLNVENSLLELDIMGKLINAARSDITIRQKLVVASQTQAKTLARPINAIPNINSNKPVPLNSTAPVTQKIVNNPLQPNTAIAISTPSNNQPPGPVGYTAEERTALTKPIKDATQTVIKKKDIKIEDDLNFSVAKVSTLLPEFPRMPFAFAVTSPFGIFSAVKTVVCTLANLDINSVLKFKIPKLSDVFKKPDFNKFKNQLSALLLKVQIFIIKQILALIPPLPDIVGLINSLKKQLKEALKKLFNCNPDNQN